MAASEISNNKNLESKIWKDFVDYHCSKEFFLEFLRFLKMKSLLLIEVHKRIIENHNNQNFIEMRGAFHKSRSEIKKKIKSEFVLDCQPSITTPNINGQKTVRGPHVDSPYKLYAGLFYLRDINDKLEGGDIILYKSKTSEI